MREFLILATESVNVSVTFERLEKRPETLRVKREMEQ
jgi:hypothetical protein